jgi:hypothetical protein
LTLITVARNCIGRALPIGRRRSNHHGHAQPAI